MVFMGKRKESDVPNRVQRILTMQMNGDHKNITMHDRLIR